MRTTCGKRISIGVTAVSPAKAHLKPLAVLAQKARSVLPICCRNIPARIQPENRCARSTVNPFGRPVSGGINAKVPALIRSSTAAGFNLAGRGRLKTARP